MHQYSYSVKGRATSKYLVVKESGQPHQKDLKDTGLEKGDLVVVVETLEARNDFGKGADLPDQVHEPVRELFFRLGNCFVRMTLHGASLWEEN